MADKPNGKIDPAAAPQPPQQQQQIQVKILSQYVKDLSFENPNIRKLIASSGDAPNLKVEVNVNAETDGKKSSFKFQVEK